MSQRTGLVDATAEGMRIARYKAMNESLFLGSWNAILKARTPNGASLAARANHRAQNEPIVEIVNPETIDIYASSCESTEAAASVLTDLSPSEFEPVAAISLPFEPLTGLCGTAGMSLAAA